MEPEVVQVTTAALDRFTAMGMTVDTFDDLPSAGAFTGNESLWPAWITLRSQFAGRAVKAFHDVPAWRGLLKDDRDVDQRAGGGGAEGLPLGLQIIGRNHDDCALTALAAAGERQTTAWQWTLPPLSR